MNPPYQTGTEAPKRFKLFRRHPKLTGLGICTALLLFGIFVLLPPILGWSMERWLEKGGELDVDIRHVDFNLFTGNLAVHSLIASRNGEDAMRWTRAAVEVAWAPVFKKRLRLNDILLTNATIDLVKKESGKVYVAGVPIVSGESKGGEEPGWAIGLGSVDLRDVTIRYRSPEVQQQVIIEKAHVDPMQSWNPSSGAGYSISFSLAGGRADAEGKVAPFSDRPMIEGTFKVKDIPLGWTSAFLKPQYLRDLKAVFSADTEFTFSWAATNALHLDGTLSLAQLAGSLPELRINPATVTWEGSIAVNMETEAGIDADGTLSVQALDLRLPSTKLDISADSIQVNGNFSRNRESVARNINFLLSANGIVEQARMAQAGADHALVEIGRLSLNEVRLEGTDLYKSNRITAARINLLKRPQAEKGQETQVVGLSEARFQDVLVEADKRHLQVNSVTLKECSGFVVRTESGLEIDRLLPRPVRENEDKEETPAAKPWTYAVASLALEEAELRFLDRTVSPRVDVSLHNIDGRIKALNSAAPGEKSAIDVRADIGKFGQIRTGGTIQPFSQQVNLEVTGELKEFRLPEIRGYVRKSVGYTVQSGQLFSDFRLRVAQTALDSEFKLYITGLSLERVSAKEEDEFAESLGMPLNAALDLLRDGNGNIRLVLPVEGSLARPEVRLADVIGKAVKNAMFKGIKTAALTYFAPLGAAYVATKLFGKIVALRFEPIVFEPGRMLLPEESKSYLDRVAKKLKDRPETRLLLCGKAIQEDAAALTPQNDKGDKQEGEDTDSQKSPAMASISETALLDLAKGRAEAAKAYLISRGIESRRLQICTPDIDEETPSKPRVELAI